MKQLTIKDFISDYNKLVVSCPHELLRGIETSILIETHYQNIADECYKWLKEK